jgi:hypothetical protein
MQISVCIVNAVAQAELEYDFITPEPVGSCRCLSNVERLADAMLGFYPNGRSSDSGLTQ